MKNAVAIRSVVILIYGSLVSAASARQVQIHVAPDGDDSRTGTSRASAVGSLGAARERVRVVKQAGDFGNTRGVEVILHAGEYRLGSTFVLSPEDSGMAEAPVVYRAAPGGSVIVTGGSSLGRWEPAEREGRCVWRAEIPQELRAERGGPLPFRSLWIGASRRTRARHPDGGYLQLQDVPDVASGTAWHQGQTYFRFKEADKTVWEKVAPGTELVGFTRWVDTHLVVMGVDLDARRANFTRPAMFLFSPNDWYFIEGRQFLDAPGEWCVDESGAHVLYVPMKDERPEEAGAVVPRLRELVRFSGRPEKGEFVEHVRFEGLTFAHATWWFDSDFKATWPSPEVQGFAQAASGVPGAIRADGARHVEFRGCDIEHVEGYAIEFARGCTKNRIAGCRVRDLGAGGIKIGETAIRDDERERTHSNRVEDCEVTDGGHIHHQAVGVWIGQSGTNVVSHNLIDGFHYTGISIGWTWGYGASLAGGNTVEFNEVGNIGKRAGETEAPLGDMAGIYTLGTQAGTAIRNNYFHDIAGRSIAWGIYFDEGSTGIVAENNVVARTTHGGFHQHYGKDNLVRNNVFLDGRDAQIWKSRREEHNAFTFTRNIVVWSSDGFMAGDWSGADFTLANNIYWRRDGKPIVFPGGVDLAAWQLSGRDAGSVIADPGIGSVGKAMIAGGPTARSAEFTPIDLRTVGPRRR